MEKVMERFALKIGTVAAVFAVAQLQPAIAVATDDLRRDATVQAVERVLPSVVNISTEEVVYHRDPFEALLRDFWGPFYQRRPNAEVKYSLGSGVIIDESGFMLTNLHVVRRASRIWVTPAKSGETYEAEIVAAVEGSDLALLRIKAPEGTPFVAVEFAPEGDLLLGETVLALGNPFGLGGSVSKGILSSNTRRALNENEPLNVEDWIQTDAAINPGNSGGPLVDMGGRLIGLNVAIYHEGQGIGFAVPVKRINDSLSTMYSTERLAEIWFGARLNPGSLPLQVGYVQGGSPAANAGLQAGDRVLAVNGAPPTSFFDFVNRLIKNGDKVERTLTVRRGDSKKTLEVKLVHERDYFDERYVRGRTGLSLQPLTDTLAREFGLRGARGMLVSDVEPKSPANRAGIESGMIVEGVNGVRADDAFGIAKILREKTVGESAILSVLARGGFSRSALVRRNIQLRLE
jgi:S1-C subfamily serine protease